MGGKAGIYLRQVLGAVLPFNNLVEAPTDAELIEFAESLIWNTHVLLNFVIVWISIELLGNLAIFCLIT